MSQLDDDERSYMHRRSELAKFLNRMSLENGSDTPDFILAEYMLDCLNAFDRAVVARDVWCESKEASS